MEQSFNDCLYNLGSTVTPVSKAALSNAPSCSMLPSPVSPSGSPAKPKAGMGHALLKLSSHHTSYQSSLGCDPQNKPSLPLELQFLPCPWTAWQCPRDSSKTIALLESCSPSAQLQDGGERTTPPLAAPLQQAKGWGLPQTTALLCLTEMPGCLQSHHSSWQRLSVVLPLGYPIHW